MTVVRLPGATAVALLAATAAADHGCGDDRGGWPMAGDAVGLLTALVAELRAAHVVEFGSGRSTVALAQAAARLPVPGAVTVIENDPEVYGATRAALAAAGVASDRVAVQAAPLVVRRIAGRHLPVYHLRRGDFASAAVPDLVVVDGPPSMLGGRQGALLQALGLAGVGTLVLLDDADRPQEAAVLDSAVRTYRGRLEQLPAPGFSRGLGALVVTAPLDVPVDPLVEAACHAAR